MVIIVVIRLIKLISVILSLIWTILSVCVCMHDLFMKFIQPFLVCPIRGSWCTVLPHSEVNASSEGNLSWSCSQKYWKETACLWLVRMGTLQLVVITVLWLRLSFHPLSCRLNNDETTPWENKAYTSLVLLSGSQSSPHLFDKEEQLSFPLISMASVAYVLF